MQPKGSDQIWHIDSDRQLCEATDKKPMKASLAQKGMRNDVDYYNDDRDNHSDVNKNDNRVSLSKPQSCQFCKNLLLEFGRTAVGIHRNLLYSILVNFPLFLEY